MSEKQTPLRIDGYEEEIEAERYELREGPAYRFGVARRDLFRALGAGLLVVAVAPASDTRPAEAAAAPQQESGGGGGQRRGGAGRGAGGAPQEIAAWLHIGEDGTVTAYSGKVEVGQNARTSLAQAVAEELNVPLASVRMVLGDTDLTPYDAGTFGSRTTPAMAPQMRRAAVAARETLLDLAAEQMKVARGDLVAAEGKVVHAASQQARGYGELTRGQKLTKQIEGEVALTPPDRWTVAGKSAPKVNARDIVTGKHQYTSDIRRPGMLHGKVLRPAAYGATLVSLDASAAEKMPGVVVVRDGDFVGVAAPGSSHDANLALFALKAEWKAPTDAPAAKDLFPLLKQPTEGGRGQNDARGSVADGLASAAHKFERTYTVAYIAHAPLEPRAAVAEWGADGRLTVWTGTQRPFGVRGELAQAFSLPEEKVRVIVPDTGSGYGGKHTGEAAIEAARLAKAAGKPVKLVWTREEEFTWAYFRPAGVIEVTSGVAADGTITAWEFHNYNSGGSGLRPVYDIANQRCAFHPARSPLRQGSYRALASTANHFAREMQVDEMARAVKMDPLALRLKNLKDERMRAVLQAAADGFGWGKAKPAEGRGFGIAGGFEKGGYVANCVEVSVEPGSGNVRLRRVVTAFECGAIVNPEHLENQVEGAVIQAIGGALFEAIDFADGRIGNPYFSMYRLPRFSDVPPDMKTVLVDRKDLPSAGAGEAPMVALAPAIGAAIFDACGVRLRALPLAPKGVPKDAKA
jgi:Aerobic-type carbon monoxide dehydrogenase, large subunit CoxL/CutL homologs